jgi:hypothetical protein
VIRWWIVETKYPSSAKAEDEIYVKTTELPSPIAPTLFWINPERKGLRVQTNCKVIL